MRKGKRLVVLALMATLVLGLSIPALADAPTQAGFYVKGSASNVTIKGVTANKTAITAVRAKPINSSAPDADDYREFYPGSAQLEVTLSSTDSSLQYLVILSAGETITENTLKYIDQKGNGGSLTFYVYPDTLTANTRLTLWITNSGGGDPVKVSLGYWAETSYEEQPYTVGDADGDDKVTANDASLALQYAVDIHTGYEDAIKIACDVDGDTKITANDASLILQYAVDLITEWPK